jgi:hypothetical protein
VADKRFEYWYDWDIHGPDGVMLFSFKDSPPPIDLERLTDTEYLCEQIYEYPEATLMNKKVWYRIIKLRENAFKDKEYVEPLRKICNAILGDGRNRKSQEKLDELLIIIKNDISFFRDILEISKAPNMTVDKAIENYVTRGADPTSELYHKFYPQKSNYNRAYYAYRPIFEKLREIMTDVEIFCFFEKAAENIYHPEASIDVEPDNRLLTFVKKTTWYTLGSDMKIEV